VFAVLITARVELDVVRSPGFHGAMAESAPGTPGAVLFVAAELPWPASDAAELERFERELRARIERIYVRHGVSPVEYQLELL
jgi:hypothetical protein